MVLTCLILSFVWLGDLRHASKHKSQLGLKTLSYTYCIYMFFLWLENQYIVFCVGFYVTVYLCSHQFQDMLKVQCQMQLCLDIFALKLDHYLFSFITLFVSIYKLFTYTHPYVYMHAIFVLYLTTCWFCLHLLLHVLYIYTLIYITCIPYVNMFLLSLEFSMLVYLWLQGRHLHLTSLDNFIPRWLPSLPWPPQLLPMPWRCRRWHQASQCQPLLKHWCWALSWALCQSLCWASLYQPGCNSKRDLLWVFEWDEITAQLSLNDFNELEVSGCVLRDILRSGGFFGEEGP